MSAASDLIRKAKARGIELRADGDVLVVTLSDGIDDATKAELIRLKPEVLALLRSANRPALSPELAPVLRWLHFVGETQPDIIDEVLDKCRRDPDAFANFLHWAKEVPPEDTPKSIDDRVICGNCRHFQQDTVNPVAGIGTCQIGAGRHGPCLWPMAMRWCGHYAEVEP